MSLLTGQFATEVQEAIEQLQDGWGMPTKWYCDADVYQFEMRHIYAKEWQYFAPTEQLANTGDCYVAEVADVPVFVVRGADGELRGFVNVCRHRGHPVVKDNGNSRAFVCPYHGWTYNLDGTLKRAPQCESESGFEANALSLLTVSVDSWGPAVFVNVDPRAVPLRQAHPKFEETWRSRGLTDDVGAYRFRRRIVYDAKANWKLWYDNNVECYHCPRIHGTSFAAAYNVSPESYDAYEVDRLMTYKFAATDGTDTDDLRSNNYRSMQLFPGITIIQQDDLMVLSQMLPLAPEQTVSVMDYFSETGSDLGRVDRWIELWDQTFKEDLTAAKNQQRSMNAGRLERSRFLRSVERPLVFINQTVLDAYQKGIAIDAAH